MTLEEKYPLENFPKSHIDRCALAERIKKDTLKETGLDAMFRSGLSLALLCAELPEFADMSGELCAELCWRDQRSAKDELPQEYRARLKGLVNVVLPLDYSKLPKDQDELSSIVDRATWFDVKAKELSMYWGLRVKLAKGLVSLKRFEVSRLPHYGLGVASYANQAELIYDEARATPDEARGYLEFMAMAKLLEQNLAIRQRLGKSSKEKMAPIGALLEATLLRVRDERAASLALSQV